MLTILQMGSVSLNLLLLTILARVNLRVCDYVTVSILLTRAVVTYLLFKLMSEGHEGYHYDRKQLHDSITYPVLLSLLLFAVNWKIDLSFCIPIMLIGHSLESKNAYTDADNNMDCFVLPANDVLR